jgi:Peptidase family M28
MMPILALSLALSAEPFPFEKAEQELSEEIREEELKAHVYRLASAEFLGRRGPGAARAAAHIAEMFERLKLKPAFGDAYYQPIPWLLAEGRNKHDSFVGKNVGCMIPGSDPKLKDEWILLSCHLDHLGKNGAKIYPGADDNASGCAMVLEVAERFALQKAKPRRTILFVAFDQEETGLQGSTHFAAHPPLPLKDLKAFLTADMIGRSMGNVMDEYVFALGSECSQELRKLLEDNPPKEGLKVGRVGADMIGTRSDYGPFRDRKVPFLFFSTGQHPDYHTTRDTPERIDFPKLWRISNWIFDLTAKLADLEAPPVWVKDGLPPDLDEVKTIRLLLTRVLAKPLAFNLSESQQKMVQSTCEKLDAIVKRGTYKPAERSGLLWVAKLLMASVF